MSHIRRRKPIWRRLFSSSCRGRWKSVPIIEERKDLALNALFHDLANLAATPQIAGNQVEREERLCRMIEWLYEGRERLGQATFTAANRRIRDALRQMLDEELRIAKAD